jgi:hypothetical protein
MKRKMIFLARAMAYLLAFLVPPLLVSVVGMKAAESARYEAGIATRCAPAPTSPRGDGGGFDGGGDGGGGSS